MLSLFGGDHLAQLAPGADATAIAVEHQRAQIPEILPRHQPVGIAFEAAADAMGIARRDRSRIVIVGDDPALEMRMAHNTGATGIGMTTGIMKPETLAMLKPNQQPHAVIDRLRLLHDAL